MSRWKASGIHLLLSVAIVGAFLVLMLTVWFPWPLFEAVGGSRLIFILASVDVTIGPLITLIIFRSGKMGRPRVIAGEPPTDPKLQGQLFDSALSGRDLQMFPQYYVEYPRLMAQALAKARPVDILRKRDVAALDGYLQAHKLTDSAVRFLPLRAPKRDGAVIVDAKTAAPLQTLLIDPW